MTVLTALKTTLGRYAFLFVFLASFLLYGFSAGLMITRQSRTPQYVYLAYSFLHGHLDLIALPESKYDLISYQDRWYVPGGMAPALLLLPVVAAFGLGVSDVLFGVIVGALNVMLVYSLLDDLLPDQPRTRNWLTILFAAGTVHWWVASMGSVWFNAHLVGLFFTVLFVRQTLQDKHPGLAGLWLGLAGLARPTILFVAPFYLLVIRDRHRSWSIVLRKLIPFGLTISGVLAAMLAYNYLRFGHPLEFGYGYLRGSPALTSTYTQTGGFNPGYMPCNMYVSILGMPNLEWNPLPGVNEVCSYLEPVNHDFGKLSRFFNPLGMSIFLTTPALLLIFRAKIHDPLVIPAWAGVLCTLIPLWMYHTTGWVQFGYRYVLDVIVLLLILLSRSIRQDGYLEKTLLALSIVMGWMGVRLMYYMTFEVTWTDMILEVIRKIISRLF